MTECERIGWDIVPFVEGELAASQARAVGAHLKSCRGCWWKAMKLSKVVRLLLVDEPGEVPRGLAARTLVRASAYMT